MVWRLIFFSFSPSNGGAALSAHVHGARLDASLCVAWQLRKKLEVLGHQIEAGVPELLDAPVVNEGVQGRLEVAQPQDPGADLKEAVLVVEAVAECCRQAVSGEGRPADRKHREEDEDGGEGTGLEAHIYINLEGPLEAEQAELAGLAQADAVRVAVDADGVVADCVQDPHERVQHDHERDEEKNEHQYQYVGVVSRIMAVAKHTLRGPGRDLEGRGTNSQREGKNKCESPGDHDEHFSSLRAQLVLLLDNNKKAIYAYYKQYSHAFHDKEPKEHGWNAAESVSENPFGGHDGNESEGHVQDGQHHVRKCQARQEDVDGRAHGGPLVHHQAHHHVSQQGQQQDYHHGNAEEDLQRQADARRALQGLCWLSGRLPGRRGAQGNVCRGDVSHR